MDEKNTIRCLNCEEVLNADAKFCHQCGQKNKQSKLPFKDLFIDFLGDYFTFDSKIFRSIFPLIIRPGFLTNQYNSGKRIKYIPPLRLYIFISFLYLFMLSINYSTDQKEQSLAEQENFLLSDSVENEKQLSFDLNDTTKSFSVSEFDSLISGKDTETILSELGIPDNFFYRKLVNQIIKLIKQKGALNDILKEVVNNASVMMFLFLPLIGLMLKFLYVRRKIYYIEHLIFVFHYHSFVFFLLILSLILQYFIPEVNIYFYIALISLVYLFLAMFYVYRQKILKTFLKFSVLISFYFFCLLLFLSGNFILSFLFF